MRLAELFAGHRTLRTVIDSVCEGLLGRIDADDAARPRVARLSMGCYAIFGGDPALPVAKHLVRTVPPPCELLVPDDQSWRDLLDATHGSRLSDRPMRTFSPHALSPPALAEIAGRTPGGFAVERMDAETAVQLDATLTPHALQVFPDAQAFAARGIGFAALREGRVASAATSYAVSSRRVEIAVSTREEFRGLGLARAVSARMLLHCIERGLAPEWSASNPVSKRLALGLGYRPGPLCDVFYLGA